MTNWIVVCQEFNDNNRVLQSIVTAAILNSLNTSYTQVGNAIINVNPVRYDENGETSLQITPSIIQSLRLLKTRLTFLGLSNFFLPRLIDFCQRVEEIHPSGDYLFQEKTLSHVSSSIFGCKAGHDRYVPGFINLLEDRKTLRALSTFSYQGYRLFHFFSNTPSSISYHGCGLFHLSPLIVLFETLMVRNREKLKEILKTHPELLFKRMNVIQVNYNQVNYNNVIQVNYNKERVFSEVTPFTYALWGLDAISCQIMLDALPKNEWGEAMRKELCLECKQVQDQGVRFKIGASIYQQSHFQISELLSAIQSRAESWDMRKRQKHDSAHFEQRISAAMSLLPGLPFPSSDIPNSFNAAFEFCDKLEKNFNEQIRSLDNFVQRLNQPLVFDADQEDHSWSNIM